VAKAHIHAASSARRYGGKADDYVALHRFLDDSKTAFCDNRHRALTHNSWFIATIIPLVFGHTAVNSDGKTYSPVDVAEWHVAEDYGGFIPSAADFLSEMELKDWMQNGRGAPPPSAKKLRGRSGPAKD
jgi:ribosomal protein S19